MNKIRFVLAAIAFAVFTQAAIAAPQAQAVTVSIAANNQSAPLPERFLGLSYESSMLLPKESRYYFDPNDQALINSFKTLGMKSLRVAANAVN
jgi:hypothetical protein